MCVRACVYACVSVFCLLWQLHIFVSAQNKRLASRHKVDFVATKLPSVFAELCKKRVVVAKSVRLHVQTHGIAAANVPFLIYIYLFIYLLLAAKTIICGRNFSICGSDRSFDIRAHRCHTLGGNSTSFIRRRPSSLAQD